MTDDERQWSFFHPTRTFSGLDPLGAADGVLPDGTVAVVCGSAAAQRYGYVERVVESLTPERTVVVFTGVNPEPTQHDAHRLRAFLQDHDVTGVVALGGGSVIDVAKVACALSGTDLPLADVMNRSVAVGHRRTVLIAVPTTAGSGSEVTPFAVLTNPATGLKQSVASPCLYPDFALLVPDLLSSVPRHVAADSGMDALAHAFEALWSVNANPISDGLAYHAITLIDDHFLAHLADPADARHNHPMAVAALTAGMAFSNTFTAACHAMSYPISARFGISHGAACAVTLDLVARRNAEAVEGKFRHLARLLALDASTDVPARIAQLRDATGTVPRLADLGGTKEDRRVIARNAYPPLLANNPVKLDEDAIVELLAPILPPVVGEN